jgi:hypothetical protein
MFDSEFVLLIYCVYVTFFDLINLNTFHYTVNIYQ